MNLEQGDIISDGDGNHKQILSVNGRTAKVCWYSYEGKMFAFIGIANCKFISHKETKKFQEMKALYEKGHDSFLRNEDSKKRRRLELARAIDHRKKINRLSNLF